MWKQPTETHIIVQSDECDCVLAVYAWLRNDLFFDETSKTVYNQLAKNSSVQSRVMLNIEQFEIGTRYVIKYKIDTERRVLLTYKKVDQE